MSKPFNTPQSLNEFYSDRNEYDKGNGVTRVSLASFGEDEILAAWMDKRRGGNGYGIFATRSHKGPGTTTTISRISRIRLKTARVRSRIGLSPTCRNCFGSLPPIRTPIPPAAITTPTLGIGLSKIFYEEGKFREHLG